MLIDAIAERPTNTDPVDLAMTFLTGLFGLLATDEAAPAARRARLDLLVRLAATGATTHDHPPHESLDRRALCHVTSQPPSSTASARCGGCREKHNFAVGDFNKAFEFDDESFDAVYAIQPMTYVSDHAHTFSEVSGS